MPSSSMYPQQQDYGYGGAMYAQQQYGALEARLRRGLADALGIAVAPDADFVVAGGYVGGDHDGWSPTSFSAALRNRVPSSSLPLVLSGLGSRRRDRDRGRAFFFVFFGGFMFGTCGDEFAANGPAATPLLPCGCLD